MKRVINLEEKYKDENLKYLVDSVTLTINNILLIADPLGIPVRVQDKPKVNKSKGA